MPDSFLTAHYSTFVESHSSLERSCNPAGPLPGLPRERSDEESALCRLRSPHEKVPLTGESCDCPRGRIIHGSAGTSALYPWLVNSELFPQNGGSVPFRATRRDKKAARDFSPRHLWRAHLEVWSIVLRCIVHTFSSYARKRLLPSQDASCSRTTARLNIEKRTFTFRVSPTC